ncbi:MAG: hypothetical protein ACT4P2_13780 [Pseudomonadota bacterium]
MSLVGHGAIAIWNDIAPDGRASFYAWHGREHVPERVGIPGFLRGRRYVAIHGSPEFFTLYETAGPQTISGVDYLTRLNNPTPWTREAVKAFRNTARSLCRVVATHGFGQGGLLATWRYDVAPGREEEQRHLLCHRILPELVNRPGVAGAHLCVADVAASSLDTAERREHSQDRAILGWVVMVEGWDDPEPFDALLRSVLSEAVLAGAGAKAPVAYGLYRLQYSCCKTPSTAG